MSPPPSIPPLPTHHSLLTFLTHYLPPTSIPDIPLLYHTPRFPNYSPSTSSISHLLLALQPTPSLYTSLSRLHTAAFLHRPFGLDRRAIHRGNLVLASHKAFDSALTVGYNVHLAERLGMDIIEERGSLCVQGYKGDEERRIGIVGLVKTGVGFRGLVERIGGEFGGWEEVRWGGEGGLEVEREGAEIRVLAIMNAFHREEVRWVIDMAVEAGWIDGAEGGRRVLYLTGAARPYGLEAVREVGMTAVCVGHEACERWGIRFLAEKCRERWPGLDVKEIYEDPEVEVRERNVEQSSNRERG
ncbi:MAG: hypothetical protein M1820_001411 [Bogoriella megaspora]|nr:MAG: hypothetical protein M1820_001411 [Bogoriella megaspora]